MRFFVTHEWILNDVDVFEFALQEIDVEDVENTRGEYWRVNIFELTIDKLDVDVFEALTRVFLEDCLEDWRCGTLIIFEDNILEDDTIFIVVLSQK